MMTSVDFKNLLNYKSAMAQAKIMVEKGLINHEEYCVIETNLCSKFCLDFRSLFRENEWIYNEFRGNMSLESEVV